VDTNPTSSGTDDLAASLIASVGGQRLTLTHHIENMLGRLKDWRRIATRYDRCAHTFFSAICIAATITFWLE
jgi:hypothetical protein